MNVCLHARIEDAGPMISIMYWVPAPGQLKVEVADEGVEFNPLTAASPDVALDLEHRPIGGLGIFLVRQLASSLADCRRDGWNRLTFSISADSLSSINVD